jgi:hypothetical protein
MPAVTQREPWIRFGGSADANGKHVNGIGGERCRRAVGSGFRKANRWIR